MTQSHCYPTRWGLLCLVLGLVMVSAGIAQPLRPSDFVDLSGLSAWTGREVNDLEIVGLPGDIGARARAGLALTPRRKILRKNRPVLSLDIARADAQRLRLLLVQNGYPDARIEGTATAVDETRIKVTFTVIPGPAVVYGQVDVEGFPATTAAVIDSVRQHLAKGKVFRQDEVFQARDDLTLATMRAGFAQPEVSMQVVRPDSQSCDLQYLCIPGNPFVYDQLLLTGTPDDLTPLVRKTINLKPGTPFSPKVMVDTRHYLRKLQLFRQIRLDNVVQDSTTLDLAVDLKKRKMTTAEFSIGSFTDNWFVVRAGIAHRNLLKKGRGAGIGAAYATHLREIEARTWWPALIVRRSVSSLRLRFEVQDEESYQLDKFEVEVSTLFERWRTRSLRLGLAVSEGKLDNRSANEEAFASDVGLQTVLNGVWYFDTSDNPLDPLHGTRITLSTDWSPPGFWTEKPFVSFRAATSKYLSLGGLRTLAFRLDGGVAWPLGDAEDLSPDRRFFAGGVSTMRGYSRRMLGPTDSANQPVGGEVRILGSAEARLPMAGIVGMAFFVDSGQVWFRRLNVHWHDIKVAAGAGLLVRSPVGPVRLDWAYNITTPMNDQSWGVLHFAIGHPF